MTLRTHESWEDYTDAELLEELRAGFGHVANIARISEHQQLPKRETELMVATLALAVPTLAILFERLDKAVIAGGILPKAWKEAQ